MTKTAAKNAMKATRTYFADGHKFDGAYKAHTIKAIKTNGRRVARRVLNKLATIDD